MGLQDNLNEQPQPGIPLLPTPGEASLMNTFPYFRSLSIGNAVINDCGGNQISSNPAVICARLIDGFACPASIPVDYTE